MIELKKTKRSLVFSSTAESATPLEQVFTIIQLSSTTAEDVSHRETVDFVNDVQALCRINRDREAISESLKYLDDCLSNHDYYDCNKVLMTISTEKISPSVMVSILGITLSAKHKLRLRPRFYRAAFDAICKRKGKKYAKELLKKYE